jgi:predicted MPP superfamily phosphohydrolase
VAIVLLVFSVGAYWGSIFYKRILLVRPVENYPRNLNPRLRLREWKACQIRHDPLRIFLNFEDAIYYHLCLKAVLKMLGYYKRGIQNALDIKVRSLTFSFPNLPQAFHGYSILFLTDLHINGHERLPEKIKEVLGKLPAFDICILGGDYRMEDVGSYHSPLEHLSRVIPLLKEKTRDGVIAVLGNHDCIEMVTWFEQQGVRVLVNEHVAISRKGETIYFVGVDDPHYFKCHDVEAAFCGIPRQAFSIFIAHSPEVYRDAAQYGASLYLCGHTHAGQIQLPRLGAIFTHSRTGWRFVYGRWKYKSMWGYTSSGVGASGIFVRYNTRGEIVHITLLREDLESHDGRSI